MIPHLVPLITPLIARFPAAWAKAKAPHDDGEFNARVCAVLHYEHGLTNVGRNGKRGDPKNLSKDVINWKGEGANPDPVNGGFGTILDFIVGHESPSAHISQFAPDPNGPGAWVKPLTLAQIDAGSEPAPAPLPAIKPRDQFYDEFQRVNAFYAAPEGLQRPGGMVKFDEQGRPVCDSEAMGAWGYNLMLGQTVDQVKTSIRHSDEWRQKHPGESPF